MSEPGKTRTRLLRIHALRVTCLAVFAFFNSCAMGPSRSPYSADGVFVRHARIRVSPAHTKPLEALLAQCVATARSAQLPAASKWNCYRESPGRYWLLWYGDGIDGFHYPAASDSLRAFVQQIGRSVGGATRADIERRLSELDYVVEWTIVLRRKSEWCTADAVSLTSYPKARLMLRSVKRGQEVAFGRAVEARTEFLEEHGYSLPLEGFATVVGPARTEIQMLYAVDWSRFHASTSIGHFVRGLSESASAAYATRKQALMVTMDRAEFYDADYMTELSWSP